MLVWVWSSELGTCLLGDGLIIDLDFRDLQDSEEKFGIGFACEGG